MRNQQSIAEMAYAIWHTRGCPDGTAEEDWLEAEQLLCRPAEDMRSASDEVDEALEETFPASDPPAGQLADEPPSNAEEKWKAREMTRTGSSS